MQTRHLNCYIQGPQYTFHSIRQSTEWLIMSRVLLLSLCSSSLDSASAQPSKYFCSVSTCLHRISLKVSISASFSLRLWPFWTDGAAAREFGRTLSGWTHDATGNPDTVNGSWGEKAHLEGGCGGGGVAAGGRGERQHGAMSPQTGLGAVARIRLCVRWRERQRKLRDAAARASLPISPSVNPNEDSMWHKRCVSPWLAVTDPVTRSASVTNPLLELI